MNPPPNIGRRSSAAALRCAACLAFNSSCLHPAAMSGRDADASLSAIRAEIRDFRAALVEVRTDLSAGRDVNQNDKWTLRLLGLGVLLLGLSYPIGKLVWLASASVRRRAGWVGSLQDRLGLPSGDVVVLGNTPPGRRDKLTRA